jgi:hypothetical protein
VPEIAAIYHELRKRGTRSANRAFAGENRTAARQCPTRVIGFVASGIERG